MEGNEFSEEEKEDVCKICHHVDPQSDNDSSDDEEVQWEGCEHCDSWYPAKCLGKVSATRYCKCEST